MAVLEPDIARPSSVPVVEKEACGKEAGPAMGEAPRDAAPAEGVSNENDSLTPITHLSWDEMMEMLKHVSCFTNSKSPFTKMSYFFPFTKRISVNMGATSPLSSQLDSPLALLSLLCSAFSSCRNGQCRRLQKW